MGAALWTKAIISDETKAREKQNTEAVAAGGGDPGDGGRTPTEWVVCEWKGEAEEAALFLYNQGLEQFFWSNLK